MLQQRRQRGGKDQPLAVVKIEQRLLAEAIAGQQQAALLGVPERKGEHAVELADAVVAPLAIGPQDRLGVGVGGEPVPKRLQPRAQRGKIVDLTVEDDHQLAVGRGHRLVTAVQIDDREPTVAEHAGGVEEGALVVGAAQPHGCRPWRRAPRDPAPRPRRPPPPRCRTWATRSRRREPRRRSDRPRAPGRSARATTRDRCASSPRR